MDMLDTDSHARQFFFIKSDTSKTFTNIILNTVYTTRIQIMNVANIMAEKSLKAIKSNL